MPEMQQPRALLKLHMRIETMRIRLLQTAEKCGLNHPKTLRMSQRMDELITEWYQIGA